MNSKPMKRTVILVGPIGYGKSSTGNKLCQGDYFTVGEDTKRITTNIKFIQANDHLLVVDCPGIGDPIDRTVFYTEFLRMHKQFLDITPINAFIMLVKFDIDKSASFLEACNQFKGSFGRLGIKTLMLLCVQSNKKKRYSQDDFHHVIAESDGYKFLKKWHPDNKNVPYCLWDNHDPYFRQNDHLEENFKHLSDYDSTMMEMAMELMQKEIDNHPQPQPEEAAN